MFDVVIIAQGKEFNLKCSTPSELKSLQEYCWNKGYAFKFSIVSGVRR